MQENYETLISLAEEMAITLPRITALAEPHRRGLASGFPLSKSDLLSWMDREDSWIPELQGCEDRAMPTHISPDCVFAKDSDDQGVPREVTSEEAQPSQIHLPPLYLRTSQVKMTSQVQPGNCQGHPVAMLDAILKNQEALRMALTNQDMLKNLVDQLQTTMSAIEDRIRAIEQQMGVFAQFTKEINQLADETNITFCP